MRMKKKAKILRYEPATFDTDLHTHICVQTIFLLIRDHYNQNR